MSKLTPKDSFFGGVTGTWMGGPLEGSGVLSPRLAYLDFGYPLARSPLSTGVNLQDNNVYGDPSVTDVLPPSAMTPLQVMSVLASARVNSGGSPTWIEPRVAVQ